MVEDSDSSCTVTGTIGVVVQLALAVLVLVVLITEYVVEKSQYECKKRSNRINRSQLHKPRNLRTFWFDSFKICTGALVSHGFNVGVAVLVTSSQTSNECAVYALAFYYEACGVPFVQLLQYGAIQYARMMSKQDNIDKNCTKLWKYIATPGIYTDRNRYSLNGCLSCQSKALVCWIFIAASISFVGGYLFFTWESSAGIEIVICVVILLFIYIFTFILAPKSSLTQTFGWVCVKLIEKAAWSMLALAQTAEFASWSLKMSTGNPNTDAWVFIALIPIVMNAFMFFMFSRISRLKIPCLDVKFRKKLDEKLDETQESQMQIENNQNSVNYNSTNNNNNIDELDIANQIQNSNNNNIMMNNENITNGNESESEHLNGSDVRMNGNGNVNIEPDENSLSLNVDDNNNNGNTKQGNTYKPLSRSSDDFAAAEQSAIDQFDMQEAFRVGIVYTLMINTTLFGMALAYLILKNSPKVWVLGLTMMLAPLLISSLGIFLFRYLIDNRKNLCCCCCQRSEYDNNNYETRSSKKNYQGYRSPTNPVENNHEYMNLNHIENKKFQM